MSNSCDAWRAATAPGVLGPDWAGRLDGIADLQTHACRRVVVVNTHVDEEFCAAGGLLAALAGLGARVDVLDVTDGDGSPEHDSVRGPDAARLVHRRALQSVVERRLGLGEVRRYRLGLLSAKVADAELDVVAALSEIVGFGDPAGLWVLSPWQRDGHPDHDVVGRATESVCHAYELHLVRYLVAAWGWLQPEDLPWRSARQLRVDGALRVRKQIALGGRLRRRHPPSVADREIYLV